MSTAAFPNPAHAAREPRMGPGRRVVYRPDNSRENGFGGFILSDQIRDVTVEVAQDIQHAARRLAPRRKAGSPPDGTAMADRFRVNRNAGTLKVAGNRRVMVHVFNEARSAAPNEFGSMIDTGETDAEGDPVMKVRNKRHRMLGRAGAKFGDFKGPNAPEF
jgi:hypothetical protein